MKFKFLYTYLLLLIGFNFATAQSPIEKPIEQYVDFIAANNVYFKDVNHIFDKFLHTWEYTNGPHYFKITFYKQEQYEFGKMSDGSNAMSITQFSDRIYSHFIYKYNGVVVYDTYPSGGDGLNTTDYSSYIDGTMIKNTNELFMYYDEPSTTGCTRILTGLLDLKHQYQGQQAQLIWTRTDKKSGYPAFGCPSGATPDTSDFQIPANMVLTKVN